jgi:hypothetical protein
MNAGDAGATGVAVRLVQQPSLHRTRRQWSILQWTVLAKISGWTGASRWTKDIVAFAQFFPRPTVFHLRGFCYCPYYYVIIVLLALPMGGVLSTTGRSTLLRKNLAALSPLP